MSAENKVIPAQQPTDPVALERWRAEVLKPQQLALEWQVSPDLLQRLRSTGDGPPFFKIGSRVCYQRGQATDWLNAQKFNSTAAYHQVEASKGQGTP